jgi:hypothetical protein
MGAHITCVVFVAQGVYRIIFSLSPISRSLRSASAAAGRFATREEAFPILVFWLLWPAPQSEKNHREMAAFSPGDARPGAMRTARLAVRPPAANHLLSGYWMAPAIKSLPPTESLK